MKAADVAMIVTAVLAQAVWIYAVIQQWSRRPGATGKMVLSGCLFISIILTGVLIIHLLG